MTRLPLAVSLLLSLWCYGGCNVKPIEPLTEDDPSSDVSKEDSQPAAPKPDKKPETDQAPAADTSAVEASTELALVPYTGTDEPVGTPIPLDVQKKLGGSSSFDDISRLALTYPSVEVRSKACQKLGRPSKYRHDQTLKVLQLALHDPAAEVRGSAAKAIELGSYGDLGWDASPLLDDLITVIGEENAGPPALKVIATFGPAAAPVVPQLAAALADPKFPNHLQVCTVLIAIGPEARGATDQLVKAIQGNYGDNGLQNYGCYTLGKLGDSATLLKLARDEDPQVRARAYSGLVQLSPIPVGTDKLLVDAYHNGSWEEKILALDAMVKIKPATPAITEAIIAATKSSDGSQRQRGYIALGTLDPLPYAGADLLKQALEKDSAFKDDIQKALLVYEGPPEKRIGVLMQRARESGGDFGNTLDDQAEQYAPILEKIVLDSTQSEEDRTLAMLGLTMLLEHRQLPPEKYQDLGKLARKCATANQPPMLRGAAAPILIETYYEGHDLTTMLFDGLEPNVPFQVRRRCLERLARQRNEELFTRMIEMLEAKDADMIESIVRNLYPYAERAAEAFPAIIALQAPDDTTGPWHPVQAQGLSFHGRPDLSEPFLTKLLANTPPDDTYYGSYQLALIKVISFNKLDPTPVLQPVLDKLKNAPNDSNRDTYLRQLALLGPLAAPAVDQIAPYLDSSNKFTVNEAITALGAIGPAAKSAAPKIAQLADKPDHVYRALNSLQKIGGGGAELAKLAPKLLNDLEHRDETIKALEATAPESSPAAAELAKIVADEDQWPRGLAVDALKAMGPAAQAAIPELKKIGSSTQDPDIREAAKQAYEAIQKP